MFVPTVVVDRPHAESDISMIRAGAKKLLVLQIRGKLGEEHGLSFACDVERPQYIHRRHSKTLKLC